VRFDGIFTRKTGFVTLDRLLTRLHPNKSKLLMVLDRPEIPLHANGSKNDIRCHVRTRTTPSASFGVSSPAKAGDPVTTGPAWGTAIPN
jgi:hypothetical protein